MLLIVALFMNLSSNKINNLWGVGFRHWRENRCPKTDTPGPVGNYVAVLGCCSDLFISCHWMVTCRFVIDASHIRRSKWCEVEPCSLGLFATRLFSCVRTSFCYTQLNLLWSECLGAVCYRNKMAIDVTGVKKCIFWSFRRRKSERFLS